MKDDLPVITVAGFDGWIVTNCCGIARGWETFDPYEKRHETVQEERQHRLTRKKTVETKEVALNARYSFDTSFQEALDTALIALQVHAQDLEPTAS